MLCNFLFFWSVSTSGWCEKKHPPCNNESGLLKEGIIGIKRSDGAVAFSTASVIGCTLQKESRLFILASV